MKKLYPVFTALTASLCAQAAILTTVGSTDMRETKVWVKFDSAPKSPTAKIFETKSPEKKSDGKFVRIGGDYNPEIYTAVFEDLAPNTEYAFEIADGESVSTGTVKTSPDYKNRTPPPDFAFVALGENHINDRRFDDPFKEPGGEYEIYETIRKTAPAFAIWAGSTNAYRNADIGSRSGMLSRQLELRALPEARALLNAQPNYGALGTNTLPDASSRGAKNHIAAFGAIWCNPPTAEKSSQAYTFSYADADFFVLDDFSNRSNLDYKQARPQMLGQPQLDWLFAALQNSKATFKFVVMNTPATNPVENADNFTFAKDERKRLLAFLSDKKIGGVVFISGKKGYGEITRHIRAGSYPIYEITAGPATARPNKEIAEMNYFRVPSSATLARSFAQIKIEGAEGARTLTMTFVNSKGDTLFSTTIKQSDLQKFE